jgi:hypothetical protein
MKLLKKHLKFDQLQINCIELSSVGMSICEVMSIIAFASVLILLELCH